MRRSLQAMPRRPYQLMPSRNSIQKKIRKAEFGWKPGVIVNAGLKSGTNTLHGTAFAFGRDAAWDARDFFDPPPLPKAPISLEQFGGSLGGAIKKDKLFYFVDYEGQRYTVGSTFVTAAPSTVSLGGTAVTQSIVDACNAIGRGAVTPLSAQIAGLPSGSCVPAPTNYTPGTSESLFPPNTGDGSVVLGLMSVNRQDNGVAKVDYHINNKNTLSGMYFQGSGGGVWNDQPYQAGIPGQTVPHGCPIFTAIPMSARGLGLGPRTRLG